MFGGNVNMHKDQIYIKNIKKQKRDYTECGWGGGGGGCRLSTGGSF